MDLSILKSIPETLDRLNVHHDFYFLDFRTGFDFQSGKRDRFPFASCYKLAVLGAALDNQALASRINDKVILSEKRISRLASGVLQTLDLPIELSLKNLLRLMISQSDGAAADLITEIIGFETVQNYINENTTNSKITHNIEGLIRRLIDLAGNLSSPEGTTRQNYLDTLRTVTSLEDYTNALDLTLLLRKLVNAGGIHLKILKESQANPRSGMYCPADVQIYGKTGTLGYWASVNDCGILSMGEEIVAVFGLTTLGWKTPRYLIENSFGEFGKTMCTIYSRDQYSPAYGP